MPVDSKIAPLKAAEDDLKLVKTLWGGTRAMRDAGVEYLPKEKAEEVHDWKNRRDRSVLTNFFKKSVRVMAGRLFEDPVSIVDAPVFQEINDDVDLDGRNMHRFAYDMTKMTIRDGLRFIVVDAPTAEGVETLADERMAGIRPYFVEVDVRDVLGWKYETAGGKRMVTQFRYKEIVTEPVDKWSNKDIEQIKVIEPGLMTTYRKNEKGDWLEHKQIETSINFVPVVPVYAGRHGYDSFEPALIDMAWLNIEHWQKSSDQSNILHVARVPILHWAGFGSPTDENGKEIEVVIGPNSLAKSPESSARLEYVEHSGAAIGAGRQDLIDIEARAVAMGADFMAPRKSGDVTATEAAINESGDMSDLSALALNIKDSIELALYYAGLMMGVEFGGYVSMNTDLGIMHAQINIPELVKLRLAGDLSREGLFEVLNKEWDTALNADEEQERLLMEGPTDMISEEV